MSIPLVQTSGDTTVEKLPHTRALLASIWRENKPEDASTFLESEPNSDGPGATDVIDASLLNQAVLYLAHEQEDELKNLLKESFGSPDDASYILVFNLLAHNSSLG